MRLFHRFEVNEGRVYECFQSTTRLDAPTEVLDLSVRASN